MDTGLTVDDLEGPDAPAVLSRLAETEPVAWIRCIGGWLVTGRAAAIEVMRGAERFTVDDPRFTTAQVVGPSMLSLDGAAHRRHRAPFVRPFRPRAVADGLEATVFRRAEELVDGMKPRGRADLRAELAGPLAVSVIGEALGLVDCDDLQLLDWYRAIADGVGRLSAGRPVSPSTEAAVEALRSRVEASRADGRRAGLLQAIDRAGLDHTGSGRSADQMSDLTTDELFSNTAVVLFGAIETGEAMISNAFFHLLSHPAQFHQVLADPQLIDQVIEESSIAMPPPTPKSGRSTGRPGSRPGRWSGFR